MSRFPEAAWCREGALGWEPEDLGSSSGLSIQLLCGFGNHSSLRSLSFPICKKREVGHVISGSPQLKYIEFLPGSETMWGCGQRGWLND